jgi:superfamily II DNA or RNA helicase
MNAHAAKVELIVDSRIRSSVLLPGEVLDALRKEFTHENPQRKIAEKRLESLPSKIDWRVRASLHATIKAQPKYERTWREDVRGFSLPRGGLIRAREVLERFGYEVESIDARSEGDPSLRHDYEHLLELRPHQDPCVDAITELEQGIVRSPTGSGKTTAAIAAAARIGLPTLIVVHTGALLEQWVRRLVVELGMKADDVGVIGDGKFKIRPITVGLQQSCARKVAEIADVFGVVICDEVHLFAAKTFAELVDLMPARYRIGVSDSEQRKDRKEYLIYDNFGEVIATVDRKKLVADDVIFDVEIRLFRTGYDPPFWREIPDVARPNYFGQLLDDMTINHERNTKIVELAIAEVKAGARVLAWCDRVEHCERLHADFAARDPRAGLLLGTKKRAAEFQRTILGVLEGDVRAAFGTYKAVGPSIDVPTMNRGIACTPIHNNKPFVNQVRGRLCRTSSGKDDAILYYPWDEAVFGLGPVEKLTRIAKVVKLLEGGAWIDAKAWLKVERARRKAEREEEERNA